MKVVVAVSGASAIILAQRLLEVLKEGDHEIYLIVSKAAEKVAKFEKVDIDSMKKLATKTFDENKIEASIASGSFEVDAMVVVPCSMKTIAGMASGYTDDLILRAADVFLKQDRKLIVVPRETPLNYIHLKNLTTLKLAGATILPANMAFYHEPKTLEDMVDFIVGKILDTLNVEHSLYKRWC